LIGQLLKTRISLLIKHPLVLAEPAVLPVITPRARQLD